MNRLERIAKRAVETRRAQGLPDKIEDPVVLAMIADRLWPQERGVDDAPAA